MSHSYAKVGEESINSDPSNRSSLGNPDNTVFYVANGLIFIPGVLFMVFVAPLLWVQFSGITVIIFMYLFVGDLVYLWLCHLIDPGIIPKKSTKQKEIGDLISQSKDRNYETKEEPPKEVIVNKIKVKMRWCQTCNIWRPPRASHCNDCDQCVEVFDHHCPWIGNCVAKRNYRFFLLFLLLTTLLCIYTFCCCLGNLYLLSFESDEKTNSKIFDVIMKSPMSAILLIYVFVLVWSVGGLGCFHTYLMCTGQSTHEEFTAKRNPYFFGTINNWIITCYPPSMPTYVRSNTACLV